MRDIVKTHFFSTPEEIQNRKGKFAKGRFGYLQALTTEFEDTTDEKAKEQVLANLGNFAYDPVNYDQLRQLRVVDMFLDMITGDEPPKLQEFGAAGLCNLCIDPRNAKIIIENGGISLLIGCLSSSQEETVLSAITTLYYLLSPQTKKEIGTKAVIDCLERYVKSSNVRLSNLATVFLQDYQKMATQQ